MLSGAVRTGIATVGCSASKSSMSGSISGRACGVSGAGRPVGVMLPSVL